ncbi:hypothetical protein K7G98_32205, partial [Saccharothrix sp. MB29]|nr:hypothetical protein [Saccharothrix sp. MB29]
MQHRAQFAQGVGHADPTADRGVPLPCLGEQGARPVQVAHDACVHRLLATDVGEQQLHLLRLPARFVEGGGGAARGGEHPRRRPVVVAE